MKIQTSSPQSLFAGAWILLIAGFVLLGITGYQYWRISGFIERSLTAPGTVTGLRPVSSSSSANSNGNVGYAPVFTFTAANGKAYSITSNASNNPPAFDVGEDVTVIYNPANPEQARIDSFWQLWALPVVLGLIGTFSFVIAAIFVFTLRYVARRIGTASLQ